VGTTRRLGEVPDARDSSNAKGAHMYFLYLILVGLVAGWAAGKIMKGSGYGIVTDIILGIAGAVVGGWILRLLGLYTTGGLLPSILAAILGAVVLVALVRVFKKL